MLWPAPCWLSDNTYQQIIVDPAKTQSNILEPQWTILIVKWNETPNVESKIEFNIGTL
jgi:hypothetical protein